LKTLTIVDQLVCECKNIGIKAKSTHNMELTNSFGNNTFYHSLYLLSVFYYNKSFDSLHSSQKNLKIIKRKKRYMIT